jgi:hypothetical protein
LRRIASDTPLDLEACEFFVRDAVLSAGAGVLRRALECVGRGRRDSHVLCPRCARRMKSVGLKSKVLCTILGDVLFRRSLFVCPHCHATLFPADRRLGVVNTDFSPGALRMMARAASRVAFARASEDLAYYANLRVSPKTVERQAERIGEEIELWMNRQDAEILRLQKQEPAPDIAKTIHASVLYIEYDGTGIPIRRAELAGQKGKQPDGTAITREVKVGCVFTQTTFDDQGRPVRDPRTTTYVGAIETSDAFGRRIYAEALRRGLYRYARVVIITDGARYNRSIFALHFPGAVYIIDIYHAREHLRSRRESSRARTAAPSRQRPMERPARRGRHRNPGHSDERTSSQASPKRQAKRHPLLPRKQRRHALRPIQSPRILPGLRRH